jgi:hypothetical protein
MMVPSLRLPRRSVATILIAIALVASACGSGAAMPSLGTPQGAPSTGGGQGGPGTGGAQGQGNGAGPEPGGAESPSGRPPGGDVAAVLPEGTQIIYRGTLSLQVDDVDASVRAGRQVVARVGGYLEGSRQTRNDDEQVASITYRIPAQRWEDALEDLRALGTVVGEETDAEEVAAQIVDREARIRNLRLSETAIQRLTEGATSIDDLLKVEGQLAQLREQIERLDAQRNGLVDQAALGTLTVTFGKVVTAIVAVVEDAGWDARKDVSAATSTLVGMLQALTSAGIWFGIVWLPILLGLAVLALIARFIVRRTGLATQIGRTGAPGS